MIRLVSKQGPGLMGVVPSVMRTGSYFANGLLKYLQHNYNEQPS